MRHAWPNCEAAWYGVNHVRGTYLLDPGAHATIRDVALTDLAGTPPLFDIPALWAAAHGYARSQGSDRLANQRQLPTAQVTNVADAGHFIALELPHRLADLANAFVEQGQPSAPVECDAKGLRTRHRTDLPRHLP